jgi:plastocyanin
MTYRPVTVACLLIACLPIAASTLTGCGSSHTSSAPAPAPDTVEVKSMAFSPADLTVHVGDTVTWKFEDRHPHNVEGTDKNGLALNSPIIDRGQWAFTFTTAGLYHYVCQLHPDMHGTVTVR